MEHLNLEMDDITTMTDYELENLFNEMVTSLEPSVTKLKDHNDEKDRLLVLLRTHEETNNLSSNELQEINDKFNFIIREMNDTIEMFNRMNKNKDKILAELYKRGVELLDIESGETVPKKTKKKRTKKVTSNIEFDCDVVINNV